MTMEPEPTTAPSPAAAALLCRCPRCGKGKLFASIVSLGLLSRCPSCGLDYDFVDTGDGPAVFGILILGVVVLGGAMIAEFKFGVPWWVHIVLWGVTTPLLALGLLRWLKAGLVALQYKHKAGEARFEDR